MTDTITAEKRLDRLRALMAWLIIALCGVVVALLVACIAALIMVVLHGDAMQVFTTAGATFGACLTLEVALAGLCLAWRSLRS